MILMSSDTKIYLECTSSQTYNPTFVPLPTAKTSWLNFLIEPHGRNTSPHNIVSLSRGVAQNVPKLSPAFPDGKAIFSIDIALSSRARILTLQKTWHIRRRQRGSRTPSVPSVALLLASLAGHLSSMWHDTWRKLL